MAKSTPSPPPAPDPVATANAQTQSNLSTAEAQAALNHVNQNTPYGSVNYSQTGTDNGVPTYTQNTTLSPAGQQIFDQEGNLVNSALGAAGNLASGIKTTPPAPTNNPFTGTPSTITPNSANMSFLNSSPQLLDQQAVDATYGRAKSFLDPQWDQQGTLLQDQLSRQGIPLGSDAYNNAMKQFDNSKTQAYNAAQDSAIMNGVQNAAVQANTAANNANTTNNIQLADTGQNFNQQLAAQNANLQNAGLNFNQQISAQDQPINLLSALISGGQATGQTAAPNVVNTPTGVNPTDIAGINNNAYQNQLASYNARLQQQNSLWGGLSSLGGSLGAAAILAP